MSNFHQMKCYDHSFLDHMSFGSPKRIRCLNPLDIMVFLLKIPVAISL